MDANTLIAHVKQFATDHNFDLNDMYVSHGGSMLLLGLRLDSNDVDLTVTPEIFAKFDNGNYPTKNLANNRKLIQVTPVIDIHLDDDTDESHTLVRDVTGILYRSAADTLRDYLILNRDKDQRSIALLKQFLEEEANDA